MHFQLGPHKVDEEVTLANDLCMPPTTDGLKG